MTRLLFLVACLIFTGCTSTNNGLRNNGKIQVTGVGRTFDEAKNDAFSKAVEIAVGAVLLTETQVKNNKLTKDEIIKHSAGYVDDFVVISKSIDPQRVILVIDVTVRSSKIAERVLNVSKADGKMQGERLSAQFSSYKTERETGDVLLRKVLSGFPSQAYNIKQVDTVEFKLDNKRNVIIRVPFELRWNYKYLTALNEALSVTHDGRTYGMAQDLIAVQSKNPDSWILGATNSYYFNDHLRAEQIARQFLGRITVRAVISDGSGNTIFTGCEEAFHLGLYTSYPFIIRGNDVAKDSVDIFVRYDSHKMKDLDKVNHIELSFSAETCYNYEQ